MPHEAADLAEEALVASGPGPVFQRNGQLVHVSGVSVFRHDGRVEVQNRLTPIEEAALREYLARLARFETFDVRAKKWKPVDPPRDLARILLARPAWRVATIRQLIATPTLREDGSLVSDAGYDKLSGLYLTEDVLKGVSVPDDPSEADAHDANERLVELFREFPFADDDQPGLGLSVALAALLTVIIRPSLPTAPLFAVTAPESGTGKSYLVDAIAMIATGTRAPVAAMGRGTEEFDKSLTANILTGQPLLALDNIIDPLGSPLLAMTITQEDIDVRLLGLSKTARATTSMTLFATGNNLRLKDDMARRTLLLRLDAQRERPEERVFDVVDLLEEIRMRRPELVSAVLTIVRWGRKNASLNDIRPMATFEVWSERVRFPLTALGHVDPIGGTDVARAADGDAEQLGAFIAAWEIGIGNEPTTVSDAIDLASQVNEDERPIHQGVAEAFNLVAGNGRSIDPRRLGRYLSRIEGRVVDGLSIRRVGEKHRAAVWRLAGSRSGSESH